MNKRENRNIFTNLICIIIIFNSIFTSINMAFANNKQQQNTDIKTKIDKLTNYADNVDSAVKSGKLSLEELRKLSRELIPQKATADSILYDTRYRLYEKKIKIYENLCDNIGI